MCVCGVCVCVCSPMVASQVGPLGPEEAYMEQDINDMVRLCHEYNVPGSAIIFAASLRFSERCVPLFVSLLNGVADGQLLFWTGTGELPVHPSTHARVSSNLSNLGFGERIGYDVQIARTCLTQSGSRAIDCTFFWSRWSRWLCGCANSHPRLAGGVASTAGLGERQPLVRGTPSGRRTPNSTPRSTSSGQLSSDAHAPAPQRAERSTSSEASI